MLYIILRKMAKLSSSKSISSSFQPHQIIAGMLEKDFIFCDDNKPNAKTDESCIIYYFGVLINELKMCEQGLLIYLW